MPPEIKPVINSLAEMTCENCVYSLPHPKGKISCHNERADNWDMYEIKDFCSKGKWMTSTPDYNEADVTNYDLCYELFGK